MFLPKAVPRARAFLQSKINHGWSATSLTVRAIGTASPLHSTILPQNVGCSSASYDHHRTAYRGLRTSATSLMSLVTHDELAGMIEGTVEVEGGYSLIDVREAHEVAAGAIPTSMHVPLGHVEEALTLDADDFKLLFKHDMPSKDQLLIVYCRSGVRSENARQIAMAAGYTDVRNYKGSWLEWESKDYPVQ